MSWADELMAALDRRATVVDTARGGVQVAREGQGPKIVVSHGGPGGFDQGLAWCRHLRDGGCEVLAVSRPGYLRTPLESGRSPQDQADLYAAMLDALHIERAAILGFSSGGPSAAQFAARHPDRTTALFLDAAILRPFVTPISAVERASLQSGFVIWLLYEIARRAPGLMTSVTVGGVSRGLDGTQKKAATAWITSDPTRFQQMKEQLTSTAPKAYRQPGWSNDEANEAELAPIPFEKITAPTLIAQGSHDAYVPIEHGINAENHIADAQRIVVEEGHHFLSLSRNYGPVARRQLEIVLEAQT